MLAHKSSTALTAILSAEKKVDDQPLPDGVKAGFKLTLDELRQRCQLFAPSDDASEITPASHEYDQVIAAAEQLAAKVDDTVRRLVILKQTFSVVSSTIQQAGKAIQEMPGAAQADFQSALERLQLRCNVYALVEQASEINPAIDGLAQVMAEVKQLEVAVDEIREGLVILEKTSIDVSSAIQRAWGTIKTMPPAAQAGFQPALKDLQTRCDAASGIKQAPDIKPAINELAQMMTEVEGLAAKVTELMPVLEQQTVRLAEIDKELSKLEKTNQKLDQPFLDLVTPKLADLKSRRDELAQAALEQLRFALGQVPNLLHEIDEAAFESATCLTWQKQKPVRQMIYGACNVWITAATKEGAAQLKDDSEKLSESLKYVEEMGSGNPNRALAKFNMDIKPRYDRLKDEYYKVFLRRSLQKEFENPNSAEMKKALGSAEYEKRLLEVWNTVEAFGSPLTRALSPAEMVAIYSYTTDDYEKINDTLKGSRRPENDVEGKQIEVMIDQLNKALAKLENQVGIFTRGEGRSTGTDDRYPLNSVFTTKAFWSSGIGVNFPGRWQITILGKTGKDIKTLSQSPHEAEVLFSPGCKFKVIARDNTEAPNKIYVTVEEV
jgi:hypothetical protein